MGGSSAGIELRYLKKERPFPGDLAIIRRWEEKEYAAQEEQRRQDLNEYSKRYAAATGEICGSISFGKEKPSGMISFLSTAGVSPNSPPTAYIREDGSFCSSRLGPGK